MPLRHGCCAAIAVFLVGLAARAQAPLDPDTEVAQRHYREGVAAYDGGRYREAIAAFEQARTVTPLPQLDFDIARSWDRLGEWAAAATAYRRYLAAAPRAPDAGEVRARLVVLDARAAGSAPPATENDPPAPAGTRAAAWVVGGIALASAVAGTALVATVAPDFAALQQRCATQPCTSADWSGAERRADAGYALWGVAGVAAVADVVLWVLAGRARRGALDEPRAWIAPTAGGVVAGARF